MVSFTFDCASHSLKACHISMPLPLGRFILTTFVPVLSWKPSARETSYEDPFQVVMAETQKKILNTEVNPV